MSKNRLKELEKENAELKAKLNSAFTMTDACPFSSTPVRENGYNESAQRKCTNLGGPKNCHRCRVAAEWEEAFG